MIKVKWVWKISKSPSAEVPSLFLLCSFLSSPILVRRKMGETWEELGRNLGGTWEEQSACADGLTVILNHFPSANLSVGLIDRSNLVGETGRWWAKGSKLVRRTRTKEKVSVISMWNLISHQIWLTVILNHFPSAKLLIFSHMAMACPPYRG